jgi:hypothetical protein
VTAVVAASGMESSRACLGDRTEVIVCDHRCCQAGEVMEGIQFVTDDKGKKVAVQIDLERYGKLWEDIHDQLVADSRAHEKSVPFAVVKRRLERRKRATRA